MNVSSPSSHVGVDWEPVGVASVKCNVVAV